MLKIAGIILVSGSIAMAGCHKAFKIKENIKIRKALYELIIRIKSNIETTGMELSEIFTFFNDDLLNKTDFLKVLKSGKDNALSEALKCIPCLPEKLLDIYLELADNLGKSRFKSIETERLSRYISLIESEEKKLIKDDEAKLVLYKKLGVLAGILATLILI